MKIGWKAQRIVQRIYTRRKKKELLCSKLYTTGIEDRNYLITIWTNTQR